MDIKSFEKSYNAILQRTEELRDEERALLAPIKARLDEIKDELRFERELRSEKIGEIFKTVELDDFYEPEKAMLLSEIAWDQGNGAIGVTKHMNKLLHGSYLRDYGFYGENPMLILLSVSVPAEPDEETLQYTAEIMEKYLTAQAELDPDARINVFEDSLSQYQSYKIGRSDNLWSLYAGGTVIYERKSLLDLLKLAPTYE